MKKLLIVLCFTPLSIFAQKSDTTVIISGNSQSVSITQDFSGTNFSSTVVFNSSKIENGGIVVYPADGERLDFFLDTKNKKLVNSLNDAPYTPISLKWFSDGKNTSIWIQNFSLSNVKFKKLAAYIRGDETKILADCNTTSIDEKGRVKIESMAIHFANQNGDFPVGFSATYENLQTIKQKILSFCFTCK